ncbi:hypothetical protein JW766_00005, partial [Candidatus Dojkabacteria bacterium]|nr:hypothetical protein [Candidatus Dojkabacteria bacterium]
MKFSDEDYDKIMSKRRNNTIQKLIDNAIKETKKINKAYFIIFGVLILLTLGTVILRIVLVELGIIQATDVSGSITTNTTWTAANSPYNLTGNVTVSDGAVLTIDAGVEVKSNGNYYLTIDNGTLDVNGSSGSEVVFKHSTSTTYGAWQGIRVLTNGTATIDYAKVYYAYIGVRVEGGSLTINDSLFETNRVGIAVYYQGSLTTARNNFNKQEYYPVNINSDYISVTLGSGANVDIIGSGTDKNGYNAIGMAFQNNIITNCPSDLCKIPSRDFAGITNIPYMVHQGYAIDGNGDELEIDPGVIIKFIGGARLHIRNGASLDVNGTSGNEVIFTSYRDDSYGGDTNNDGATSGAIADWSYVQFTGGTNTIDYAKFYYANGANILGNASTSLTVQDTLYESSGVGIDVYGRASITTARNTFNKNQYYPVVLNTDITSAAFGSGGDTDVIGTGSNANG